MCTLIVLESTITVNNIYLHNIRALSNVNLATHVVRVLCDGGVNGKHTLHFSQVINVYI